MRRLTFSFLLTINKVDKYNYFVTDEQKFERSGVKWSDLARVVLNSKKYSIVSQLSKIKRESIVKKNMLKDKQFKMARETLLRLDVQESKK